MKTGARKGNVYSLEIITFSQLKRKDKDAAQRVLDLYKDERQQGLVHICSRFMSRKCRYMSEFSLNLSKHMKFHHPNAKHPGYKITQYPGFNDLKASDFVTKPIALEKSICVARVITFEKLAWTFVGTLHVIIHPRLPFTK